jgi:anaerobic sulfite reductase subunit C
VDEDNILKIILNTYDYAKEFIDPNAPGGKEHIGYIIDRTGFEVYKEWALRGVEFLPETEVKHTVYWDALDFDARG